LLVELSDFEPDPQQFRFFQRAVRHLRCAKAQRRQPRLQIMLKSLQ
jgi:hypothetical protein